MKIKKAHISNSSSSSFIIKGSTNSVDFIVPSESITVFNVAKEMIKVRNNDPEDPSYDWGDDVLHKIKNTKLDPDTPVCFTVINGETYIDKRGGDIFVDTTHNHNWDELPFSLKYESFIRQSDYFWFIRYDLIGKLKLYSDPLRKRCEKHWEPYLEIKDTSKYVCPKCFLDEPNLEKISNGKIYYKKSE